jgi:YD repeat-containing protein
MHTRSSHKIIGAVVVLMFWLYSLAFAAPIVYEYDDLNRLVRATGNGNSVQYSYDAVGNLLQRTVSSNPATITNNNFGQVAVGYTAQPETITYTNTGTSPVTMGGVGLSGDTASFGVVGDTCSGSTIALSSSCSVTVRFSPLSPGIKNAIITLSTGGSSPVDYSFPISGEAVPPVIDVSM